jgi:hypothetical protein
VQALAFTVDRLGDIVRTLIAANGRKPPKLRPYPRPVTAAERAKHRRKIEAHRALVARVLPHKRESEI